MRLLMVWAAIIVLPVTGVAQKTPDPAFNGAVAGNDLRGAVEAIIRCEVSGSL